MRVLIFIGLKIAEISIVLILLAVVFAIMVGVTIWTFSPYFWASVMAFVDTVLYCFLFCLLCWLIKLNWEWAGGIANDLRKKKK